MFNFIKTHLPFVIALISFVLCLFWQYLDEKKVYDYWEARATITRLECEAEEEAPCYTYYDIDYDGTIYGVHAVKK